MKLREYSNRELSSPYELNIWSKVETLLESARVQKLKSRGRDGQSMYRLRLPSWWRMKICF